MFKNGRIQLKKLFAIAWVFVSLFVGTASAALTEGKEYTRLATPQPTTPGKIEIIEFFWYGCPHCYTIEPLIEAWAKQLPADVSFKREHIIWAGRPDLTPHAKIYYTLTAVGLADKYQLATFKAIQHDRIELRRENTLFDWVSKQGIDSNKFKTTYHSFAVQSQASRVEDMTKRYKIESVPAFVVNGKYLTSPAQIGKEDGTLTQVLDELIALERRKR
jgi:thiol:disulfide interchange protein DsbA